MTGKTLLLIDDSERMEQTLLSEVGVARDRLIRDAAGNLSIAGGEYAVVMLNAEFPKNFVLCRRFKKNPATAEVPVVFFTFSHEREHLRILAEHRSLPTHADHYLMPPINADRVSELLGSFLGDFIVPDASLARDGAGGDGKSDFADHEARAPSAPDAAGLSPAVTASVGGSEEFADPPGLPADFEEEPTGSDGPFDVGPGAVEPEDAFDGDSAEMLLAEAAKASALDGAPGDDVPSELDLPSPAAGVQAAFNTDRISSVENYIVTLHEEFKKIQQQLREQGAAFQEERDSLRGEKESQVNSVRSELDELRAENERLRLDQLQDSEVQHKDRRGHDEELRTHLALAEDKLKEQGVALERLEESYKAELDARDAAILELRATQGDADLLAKTKEILPAVIPHLEALLRLARVIERTNVPAAGADSEAAAETEAPSAPDVD